MRDLRDRHNWVDSPPCRQPQGTRKTGAWPASVGGPNGTNKTEDAHCLRPLPRKHPRTQSRRASGINHRKAGCPETGKSGLEGGCPEKARNHPEGTRDLAGRPTLLSAGAARLHIDGTITTLGTGAQYRAAGVLAKQHRLRRHGERLHAKASHYDGLIADNGQHPLTAKRAVLAEEIRRVNQRRSNLNDALAWSAARWTTDQAIAAGATAIYLEDLRSMEARGMGLTLNTRLSQTVRSQVAERIRHLAAESGIAVVTVPARGTSKCCPRCLTALRHTRAPDQPARPGWKWAVCPNPRCRWQATGTRARGSDTARGLAPQETTVTDRASGAMTIRAISDSAEATAVITRKPPCGIGQKPVPPGTEPHAPRPGDAGHPPRRGHPAAPASVRRDTPPRTGICPAQPAGTRT